MTNNNGRTNRAMAAITINKKKKRKKKKKKKEKGTRQNKRLQIDEK